MANIDTTKTTWDLSPLLAGDDDPKIKDYRKAVIEATDAFASKWRDRIDYLKDPTIMKEALDELEALERMPGNGNDYFYFHLRESLETANPDIKAKSGQAHEFYIAEFNKIQFFGLNIGKIPADEQKKFMNDPGLAEYKHWLEKTFKSAKHDLSEPEEKIMVLKASPASIQWQQMLSGFLAKAEREVLREDGRRAKTTEEEMLSLTGSPKKEVRDTAAAAWNDVISEYVEVAEAEFNALLSNKKIDDELRGYDRPDAARHLADDIESDVVDAVIEAVAGRNDISQRFYTLKTKLVGRKTLLYHERNIPIGDTQAEYKYDEACQLVYDTFNELDPEFSEIFQRMLKEGLIDAFPKKGKRGGAFCSGHGLHQPTYVMLNHTDRLRDVETIAHEMGHAINYEMMKKKVNSLNFGMALSIAEVPSTFMEGLIADRLRTRLEDEDRLALQMQILDGTVAAIFRQAAFYRFEQAVHQAYRENGYLSKEKIGELYLKPVNDYLGSSIEQLPGYENWWVYIPHFRMNFYVYSYVSGELIAKALHAKVKEDRGFVKEIKTFYEAGTTKSPKEIFAAMGIDITDKNFWNQGLDQIDQLLKETEQLAQKLGKL
jgi:oligoendopeptidase F